MTGRRIPCHLFPQPSRPPNLDTLQRSGALCNCDPFLILVAVVKQITSKLSIYNRAGPTARVPHNSLITRVMLVTSTFPVVCDKNTDRHSPRVWWYIWYQTLDPKIYTLRPWGRVAWQRESYEINKWNTELFTAVFGWVCIRKSMRPSRAYAYFKAQEDMSACRTTWAAACGAQTPVDKQLLQHT